MQQRGYWHVFQKYSPLVFSDIQNPTLLVEGLHVYCTPVLGWLCMSVNFASNGNTVVLNVILFAQLTAVNHFAPFAFSPWKFSVLRTEKHLIQLHTAEDALLQLASCLNSEWWIYKECVILSIYAEHLAKISDIHAILRSFTSVCKDDIIPPDRATLIWSCPSESTNLVSTVFMFLVSAGLYQCPWHKFIMQSKAEPVLWKVIGVTVVVRHPTDMTISTRRGQWNNVFLLGVAL